MDITNKIEYKVRDLATRSVILFPTRAQVTRDIKDVPLKPGVNEIIIVGLSPTVDEHSIKVEGSGAATITDIAVESLPNRELFEDVYPDADLDLSEDDESDEDEQEEPKDTPELKAIKQQLARLRDDLKRAKEIVANADNRLTFLDSYGKALNQKEHINMEETLEMYKQERAKAFEDHMAGTLEERNVNYAIHQANKEQSRLLKLDKKEKAKSNKEKSKIKKTKAKEQLKRAKREEERLKEKQRIFQERLSFWPKLCYTVRIQLDVNVFTPMSSRRASFSSDIDVAHRAPSKTMDCEESPTCDLVLSYVTTSAFWSPSYDLQLSTTNAAASLCFDARLNNSTSETWENCKITLSTSETTFSGLDDSAPTLVPWRIKLAGKGAMVDDSYILNSREENNQRRQFRDKRGGISGAKPRAHLFGIDGSNAGGSSNHALQDYQMQLMLLEQQNKKRLMMARQEPANPQFNNNPMQQQQLAQMQQQAQVQQAQVQQQAQMQMQQRQQLQMQQQQQQQQQMQQTQMPSSGGLFGSAPPPPPAAPMQQQAMFGNTNASTSNAFDQTLANYDFDFGDAGTVMPEVPVLDFEDSLIEETGLTTTYDLPGHKTLVPKTTASKQRVARVNFTNVFFSHTIVAKYQPVAHLKAKLKNNSKLTLLKGPAGLTLDGSFMGRTNLPRCSAGDSFIMNLGVDPAIKVMYPKPEVRRSTSGMFNKEDSSVYVRTVTVRNSRATAGKPVTLLVLDQIPTSEDERLRVELVNPKGLTLGGAGVATGAPGRDLKEDTDWGKATAYLKKSGQIAWDVKLNAGRAVKLALEYSLALPSGEVAMQC